MVPAPHAPQTPCAQDRGARAIFLPKGKGAGDGPMMGESGTRGTVDGQGDAQGGIAEILAHISDGLIGLDGAWRVTYMNTAAERMWRCSRAALAGAPLFETLITDPYDPLRIA